MKKKRRLPVLVLTILMAMSMILAGCTSSKEQTSSNDSKQDSEGKKDETYELTMAYIQFGGKADDADQVSEAISKITKEKINATVKLLPISVSAYVQQVNLMLAGSEKLDLVQTFPPLNYPGLAAKQSLIPLDDLLEQHGQDIKQALDPEILNSANVNGKIHGVPGLRGYSQYFGVTMRKDLVDKYNIDISKIKTYADLESVFKTIKENEPGVDPLVKGGPIGIIDAMLMADIDNLGANNGVGVLKVGGDNTLVNLYETEEYAEIAAMVRKWYQAGYMPKDIATSQETGGNLIKAGKAFAYLTNFGMDTTKNSRDTGREMVDVAFTEPITNVLDVTVFLTGIAKNSQNPEKAMQFLNLLYKDKELYDLLAYGLEGKHYVKKEGNMIALPSGESGYAGPSTIGDSFLGYLWEGTDPDFIEKSKDLDSKARLSKGLGFMFDESNLKTEVASVNNVINQYVAALNVGAIDPDKALPELNKQLKDAGADKIIEEKQKQFDAFLKRSK
ncbi:MAG: hypothetical protein K0S80_3703 [Neobacillus sp.]|nr:hypothetical protein [Neobacillus sp.]